MLRSAGCKVIRAEKASGSRREGRAELAVLLDFLRRGDTLVVTRVDRLARSIGDLHDVVRALKAKGVALKATEQPIDTSTADGEAFLDMLGVSAEFETNLRRERQMKGIAAAKARGVYAGKGRPTSIDAAEVLRLHGRRALPTAHRLRLLLGAGVSRLGASSCLWVMRKAGLRPCCEVTIQPLSITGQESAPRAASRR